MKVYVVILTPHGDFDSILGVFSTEKAADNCIGEYISDQSVYHSAAWTPYIEEFELDKQ